MDLVMQPDGMLGFDKTAFKVTFNLFILSYAIMCAHTQQSCVVPEPPTSSVFGVPEPEGFVTIGADSLYDVSKVGSYFVTFLAPFTLRIVAEIQDQRFRCAGFERNNPFT